MTDRDRLGTALDTLVDPFDAERVDWDDVVRRAGERTQPPPRVGRRRAAYGVLAAIVALTALLVVNPLADRRDGVLARALAAVGDGPVMHVVTRTPPEGTVIDLRTERRRTVRLERELWYDPARGARSVLRFAGRVMFEQGVPPDHPVQLHSIARAAEVFTRDYRNALRSGRARVLGRGEVAGEPVFWIRVRLRAARAVAFPCPSGLCQDIAVSQSTYAPVVVRYGPGRRFQERVMTLESLPAGSGTIPGPVGPRSIVSFVPLQRGTVDRREARRLLGRRPVWPGREIAALRLASIEKGGERPFRSSRPGDMRLGRPNHVITMLFGSPAAIRAKRPPRRWRRLVVVSQARRVSWSLFRSPMSQRPSFAPTAEYVPREGEVLLTGGGRQALMRLRGMFVTVTGSSPALTWRATRALAALRG
jgi:hypothetical protein